MRRNGHKCCSRDRETRNELAMRECLKCGVMFWSESKANRRCDRCAERLSEVFDWGSVRRATREFGVTL